MSQSSRQELRVVETLRELHREGASPSDLLKALVAESVEGVNLIVVMKAAFPTLRRTNIIGIWANQRRLGVSIDAQLDRRLGPYMPAGLEGDLLLEGD